MMRTFYSFFAKLVLLLENFVSKRGTFPSCCGALVKFVFLFILIIIILFIIIIIIRHTHAHAHAHAHALTHTHKR
jgi:hypothetical protein